MSQNSILQNNNWGKIKSVLQHGWSKSIEPNFKIFVATRLFLYETKRWIWVSGKKVSKTQRGKYTLEIWLLIWREKEIYSWLKKIARVDVGPKDSVKPVGSKLPKWSLQNFQEKKWHEWRNRIEIFGLKII